MAKILAEFPRSMRERPCMYPWAEWLDGIKWGLTRGEDYKISTESMQAQVGSAAKRLGVQYRTSKTDYGLAIEALLDFDTHHQGVR